MRVTAILLFASATLFPLTPCPAVTVADISQHPVVRLTDNGACDHQPVFDAEGSRLVWTGHEDPEDYNSAWDIYVADRVDNVWQEPVRLGRPGGRDSSPHLSDDGNTMVHGGGPYPGLCPEIHVRQYINGVWGPPTVLANARDMGYWSQGAKCISADGGTILAQFRHRSPPWMPHSYIMRSQNGTWSAPVLLAEKMLGPINRDGTRACGGTHHSLEVYDFTDFPQRKWVLEEEHPNVRVYGFAISDCGRRVAYCGYSSGEPHWVRVRGQRNGVWDLTEFEGPSLLGLSGDGAALLMPQYKETELYLSRFIDGQWHQPICIADIGAYFAGDAPAVNRDGAKIAFVAASNVGQQITEEMYFMEYDFPGRAVMESNIPNAPFTLSGPIELSRTTGPDSRWECDQLYVSTWTVTWGDVPFHETPPPQTQRTAVDETVFFCGNYTPSICRLGPDEVELSAGAPVLNYATGTFFVTVEMRNVTEQITFYAPMRLVFDSFSPENTRLWNGDGFTNDGKPFLDLSDLVSNGLAPDSPPLLVEVEIYNRERNPFISFEAFVTAAKAPPPEEVCTREVLSADEAMSEVRGIEYEATLTVESIALDTQGVKIAWRSVPGQTYRVSCRDDLLADWQTAAEVRATGSTTEWLDESASEESPRLRVYRVQAIPPPEPKPAT